MNTSFRYGQTLRVFFDYTACSALATRKHWKAVAAFQQYDMNGLWQIVFGALDRYVQYSQNCVRSAQQNLSSENLGRWLHALDRAEESLKWAIFAANSKGSSHCLLRSHISFALEKEAKFSINAMLAQNRGDKEQFQLWETARCICADVTQPEQYVASTALVHGSTLLLSMNFPSPTRKIITPSRSRKNSAPEPIQEASHQSDDFIRRAWACSVLVKLLPLCGAGGKEQLRSFGDKEKTALSVAQLYADVVWFHGRLRAKKQAAWVEV